jgi:hypothetical protein
MDRGRRSFVALLMIALLGGCAGRRQTVPLPPPLAAAPTPPLIVPKPAAPHPTIASNYRTGHRLELGIAHGSGFVVSRDGYLLTSAHVVAGMPMVMVTVQTPSGRMPFNATVVAIDDKTDVALIKIQHRFDDAVTFCSDDVEVGDKVYGVGFPFSVGKVYLEGYVMRTLSVVVGMEKKDGVRKERYRIPGGSYIEIHAGSGFSGSPIFSQRDHCLSGMTGLYKIHGNPIKIGPDERKKGRRPSKYITAPKQVEQPAPAMVPWLLIPSRVLRAFLEKYQVPFQTK